jgi:hypothetical protein
MDSTWLSGGKGRREQKKLQCDTLLYFEAQSTGHTAVVSSDQTKQARGGKTQKLRIFSLQALFNHFTLVSSLPPPVCDDTTNGITTGQDEATLRHGRVHEADGLVWPRDKVAVRAHHKEGEGVVG